MSKFIPGVTQLLGGSYTKHSDWRHEHEQTFNNIVREIVVGHGGLSVDDIVYEIRRRLESHYDKVYKAGGKLVENDDGSQSIEYYYIPKGAGDYRVVNRIDI